MIKELKYFFYIITIFVFLIIIGNYYFSDHNKKNSYKSINELDQKINKLSENLVILKSNTEKKVLIIKI